jgi:hypothetical protein
MMNGVKFNSVSSSLTFPIYMALWFSRVVGAHRLSVDVCEAESVMVCGECGDV